MCHLSFPVRGLLLLGLFRCHPICPNFMCILALIHHCLLFFSEQINLLCLGGMSFSQLTLFFSSSCRTRLIPQTVTQAMMTHLHSLIAKEDLFGLIFIFFFSCSHFSSFSPTSRFLSRMQFTESFLLLVPSIKFLF